MTCTKICGITTVADAMMVVEEGVDYIGLNCWPSSKRYVTSKRALEMVTAIRRCSESVKIVGVFVNPTLEEANRLQNTLGLDFLQFHGDELEPFVQSFGNKGVKAIPLSEEEDLEVVYRYSSPWVLVDSKCVDRGGSGHVADWSLAKRAAKRVPRLWLAGGLRPENVCDAIKTVQPYGVDVASGVESAPGKKDKVKVKAFLAAVRSVI